MAEIFTPPSSPLFPARRRPAAWRRAQTEIKDRRRGSISSPSLILWGGDVTERGVASIIHKHSLDGVVARCPDSNPVEGEIR